MSIVLVTEPEFRRGEMATVIPTPHVGSTTSEANRGMAERAVQNSARAEERAFARMDLLNPDVLADTR